MNRLAISIVVWNNADDAIECADSLARQTIADQMTILFVDNDSDTETIEKLRSYINKMNSDAVVLIQTGNNGGTAGGFNAAAKWAEQQKFVYIGALNADAVADTLWCESLVRELDTRPDAGLVTGRVLHRDGKYVDTTGDFYTTWGLPGPRDRDKPTDQAEAIAGDIFGVTGGSFIARTSVYSKVGLYDEILFMYYEDIDFSFRAQLQGYTARYIPDAIAYHTRGASSDTVPGLATYNTFKNLPIIFVKNVPLSLWPTIYPRFLLMYTLILGNAIMSTNRIYALKGWIMSWRYLPHSFKERRLIQKKRTVSDIYIKSIIMHDIPPEQTGMRKFRKIFTGRA